MNKNLKEYLKAIEAQNSNSLYFDVESYLRYKHSLLKAVLELFNGNNDADAVLKALKEECERCI